MRQVNNKAEVTITNLLIACILLLVFVSSALLITKDFFRDDAYQSDFNVSVLSSVETADLNSNTANASKSLQNTIFQSNKDLLESNNSLSNVDFDSFKTLTNMKGTIAFVKSVSVSVNQQLRLPPFFIEALALIVGVIVILAFLSALRGVGKL